MHRYWIMMIMLAASLSADDSILDEADTIGAWKNFSVNTDSAFIKSGSASALWKNANVRSFASPEKCPADWSSYNALSFWAYAGVKNEAQFAVTVSSPNENGAGDYYLKLITIDWQGWKEIVIPFAEFKRSRNPKGWNSIGGITFASEGYGNKPKADTVLYLDAMRLTTVSASASAPVRSDTPAASWPITYDATNIIKEAKQKPIGEGVSVQRSADGKLVYKADERGNRVPDYSFAGYRGGGVSIPDVPVRKKIAPSGGDDTAAIRSAVDAIDAMTPDENGFRGALLLTKGRYTVSDSIMITNSGIVLRGEGAGPGGTVIFHKRVVSNPGSGNFVHGIHRESGRIPTVYFKGSYPLGSDPAEILDGYVPCGGSTFHLASVDRYTVGMRIFVSAVHTQKWMDALKQNKPYEGDKTLRWERIITAVDAKERTITVNVPVTSIIDKDGGFAAGHVQTITSDPRIVDCGIEDMMFLSDYDRTKKDQYGYYNDEDHPNIAVYFDFADHSWARRLVGYSYSYALVSMNRASFLTVEDCGMLDGVSLDTPRNHSGARKYYFNAAGWNNLFQRCYGRYARHAFIMNGTYAGNVFLDCVSQKSHLPNEPHQRWMNGSMYDNIFCDTQIKLDGESTGNHGQRAANSMIWNCLIKNTRDYEADIAVNSPPSGLGRNWAVGCIILGSGKTARNIGSPDYGDDGIFESLGTFVSPRSLYLSQLAARLGPDAPKRIATAQQAKGDGALWITLIEKYGVLPEYHDPSLPWRGFENWTAIYEAPIAK